MQAFTYTGRDKHGKLRQGQRYADSIDALNEELIQEGIYPIEISAPQSKSSFQEKLNRLFSSQSQYLEDLAIFARQMQLLQKTGVPITTAISQLATNSRSKALSHALRGAIAYLEQGQSLANALAQYPDIFSPLVINIVRLGEQTGHLSDAFGHIHEYLEFEANNSKQLKSAFRYPLFVVITITLAIIILNVFVIPTFARFYTNVDMSLPWQTTLLIASSNLTMRYGWVMLCCLGVGIILISRYGATAEGKYRLDQIKLSIPVFGKLWKRIILIRFSQALSIMLNAGLSITQSLALIKEMVSNAYIGKQITDMKEAIERGTSFTQALGKVELFTPLEVQILAVGEKNGELTSSLNYIASFHNQEISFDIKRLQDLIGPIMIAVVSVLVLIIALGVYLPIWNMVNLTK